MVSTTIYGDDDLDDADCDLSLAEGEVLDILCCGFLAVSVLVPVLVDGLVADGLIFSSTVEALEHWTLTWQELLLPLGKTKWSWGLGSALNNVSPSMSIPKVFCATSEI